MALGAIVMLVAALAVGATLALGAAVRVGTGVSVGSGSSVGGGGLNMPACPNSKPYSRISANTATIAAIQYFDTRSSTYLCSSSAARAAFVSGTIAVPVGLPDRRIALVPARAV